MQSTPTADISHYTYRVTWSAEDHEFVATCLEFPSLSWLAPTQVDALTGLERVIAETTADMKSQGEPIPGPLSERAFSGKFNLRVRGDPPPTARHRSSRREAQHQPTHHPTPHQRELKANVLSCRV